MTHACTRVAAAAQAGLVNLTKLRQLDLKWNSDNCSGDLRLNGHSVSKVSEVYGDYSTVLANQGGAGSAGNCGAAPASKGPLRGAGPLASHFPGVSYQYVSQGNVCALLRGTGGAALATACRHCLACLWMGA